MAKAGNTGEAPALEVSPQQIADFWRDNLMWLVHHWLQIVIAGAAGTAIVAALLGLRAIGQRLCRRHGSLTHWPATIGRVVAQTRLWFMVLLACKLVDGYADAPVALAQTINVLFTIAAALQGALWVREFILAVIEHRAGDNDHGALGSAIGIIRLLTTVVLFAIAALMILDNLGVNVTGLVAGLGIGGIAIGLAAKGIFDDLFSALSIIFDRPFRRGDSIRWDQTSGTVEAIGLKTTRVRAVTGEEVVISNTNLLGKELHNMARLARRRIVMTIGLAYYTPAEVCARFPAMMKEVVEGVDKCVLVRCGLRNFGASSLDFELQFDVRSELYDEVFNGQHEVCVRIMERLAAEGIDFAWPTQVAIPAGPEGRPVPHFAVENHPPREEPEAEAPPVGAAVEKPQTSGEIAPE